MKSIAGGYFVSEIQQPNMVGFGRREFHIQNGVS